MCFMVGKVILAAQWEYVERDESGNDCWSGGSEGWKVIYLRCVGDRNVKASKELDGIIDHFALDQPP